MRSKRRKWDWLHRGLGLGLGITAIWIISLTVDIPIPKTALGKLGRDPDFVVMIMSTQLGWENSPEILKSIGPWGRLLLDQSAFLSGSLSSGSSLVQERESGEEPDELQFSQDQDEQDNWHSQRDTQQVKGLEPSQKKRQQETQQVGKPEAPLDGGSQWPLHSMWYRVAVILLMWALVEDWEVMDGSPDSIEKVLEA